MGVFVVWRAELVVCVTRKNPVWPVTPHQGNEQQVCVTRWKPAAVYRRQSGRHCEFEPARRSGCWGVGVCVSQGQSQRGG